VSGRTGRAGTAPRSVPPSRYLRPDVRVYVDAENVRRSLWPNLGRDELVALVEAWGRREGVRPVVVFEGRETADDEIARQAAAHDGPYRLVTSDRGLRSAPAAAPSA
jgi:hypothetical protein